LSDRRYRVLGRPACRHCNSRPASRARGLCCVCYDDRSVCHLYSRARGASFVDSGKHPISQKSTDAMPGTEDKIRVMMGRAGRQEQLFHPADARYGVTPTGAEHILGQ
jgi:hypothetical protein